MKIENGLRFDNRYLLRISVESMYVQFAVPGFEIYVAERLEPAGQHLREADKYAPVAGKFFQVEMALPVARALQKIFKKTIDTSAEICYSA